MHPGTRLRLQRSPCNDCSIYYSHKLDNYWNDCSKSLRKLLTPSTDKFPIIAHLVTTMFVSGKIAFSHAPSLLKSSARPCNENARLDNRMSHTMALLYNKLIKMVLFELIYIFNKNLVSQSCSFEARFKLLTECVILYLVKEVNWLVPPRLRHLKLHFVGTIPINSICEWEYQVHSCGKDDKFIRRE